MLKLSKYFRSIKIREYSSRLNTDLDPKLKGKDEEPDKHHVDFYMKIFGEFFELI